MSVSRHLGKIPLIISLMSNHWGESIATLYLMWRLVGCDVIATSENLTRWVFRRGFIAHAKHSSARTHGPFHLSVDYVPIFVLAGQSIAAIQTGMLLWLPTSVRRWQVLLLCTGMVGCKGPARTSMRGEESCRAAGLSTVLVVQSRHDVQ